VVLEENGWLSQSLVNAVATTILQEMLGYTVVMHHTEDLMGTAERVAEATSHASLEYWPFGKAAKHAWRTRAGQASKQHTGSVAGSPQP
jgi:hypothetical protein